jgi:hypothetical protein
MSLPFLSQTTEADVTSLSNLALQWTGKTSPSVAVANVDPRLTNKWGKSEGHKQGEKGRKKKENP